MVLPGMICRTLRVLTRFWRKGHPWWQKMIFFDYGKYPDSFMYIFIKVCQAWAIKNGGSWTMLRVPEQDLEDRVILYVIDDLVWPWKILWKLFVDLISRSVPGMEVNNGDTYRKIEGLWPFTWRTASSLRSKYLFGLLWVIIRTVVTKVSNDK